MATKSETELSYQQTNLDDKQLECVAAMKHWIETEATFRSQSDEDFILMFLRSCDFDMELTKKTLTWYYGVKRDYPQWWTNRDLSNSSMQRLLKLRCVTVLNNSDINQNSVVVNCMERMENDRENFDDYIKFLGTVFEILIRRPNSQANGVLWIYDFKGYKTWIILRFLSPILAKQYLDNFYSAMPVKHVKMVMLNAPWIVNAIIKVFMALLPSIIKKKCVVYGSKWPTISDHVPLEILPDEYGGHGGPLRKHEDMFIEEFKAFNDYVVQHDDKYGFI
ncbi:hypothetical protein CHUAL_002028 [Chamberlinius hualienensis]